MKSDDLYPDDADFVLILESDLAGDHREDFVSPNVVRRLIRIHKKMCAAYLLLEGKNG